MSRPSIAITTLNQPSESVLINIIKTSFGLNQPPFDDLDSDLLLLAFTPTCQSYLSAETKLRTETKYLTCDHQSLEFYGDRFLYSVIASYILDICGLDKTPGFLTKVTSKLTNNRVLTDLMINKNACSLVTGGNYLINDNKPFHNRCGDSLEALIGALFIHLRSKEVEPVETIKKWLSINTNISDIMYDVIRRNGSSDIIYRYNDVATIASLNQGSENYVSEVAILVSGQESLEEIYQLLGWDYSPNLIKLQEHLVASISGYPNKFLVEIGRGRDFNEASVRAKAFLYRYGYIVQAQYIMPYFR